MGKECNIHNRENRYLTMSEGYIFLCCGIRVVPRPHSSLVGMGAVFFIIQNIKEEIDMSIQSEIEKRKSSGN